MKASGRRVALVVLLGGPIFFLSRAAFAGGTPHQLKAALSAAREAREDERRLLIGQFRNALRLQQELVARRQSLKKDISAAKVSAGRLLRAIETENRWFARRYDELQARARAATRDNAFSLLLEAEHLREDVERAQHERRDQLARVQRLTETLQRKDGDLQGTFARLDGLDNEVTEIARKLRWDRATPPPPVQCEVLAAASPGAIEISAGSGDGLREGDRLHVCTDDPSGERVACVVVVRTTPHKAVCARVGPPSPRKVWKGYRVFSQMPQAYCSGIEGVVFTVQGGLLEISIGSDDGVSKGAWLRIFRADGSMYLGKAQVLQTAPDKSVCKVLPETRKGVITKGDRVSSGIDDR